MGSNNFVTTSTTLVCSITLLFGLVTFVGFGSASTYAEDRAECTDKLIALATCLKYVGGEAKSPTPDCCAGFKTVVDKSPRCLCILIKDRNDPNLGLKVNVTIALNLPSLCQVPLNVTTCIDLLHLAPNSEDAKAFVEFEKILVGKNNTASASAGTSPSHSSNSEVKPNNGWKGKRCQGLIEIVFVTLLWFFNILMVF